MKSVDRLIDITRQINFNLDLDQILQLVVNTIADDIADADLVGFFMKNQGEAIYRGRTGNHPVFDVTKLSVHPDEDEFVKEIVMTRESLYIPDTDKDHRLNRAKKDMMKIQSILGVPVIVEQEVFGLVFVHNFSRSMNLSKEDIKQIEAFVNMASVAIHNAQIFEQSRVLLQQQKLMLEVTHALSQSLSVEDVVETSFKYVQLTTGAKEIGLHLFDAGTDRFKPFKFVTTTGISEEDWKKKHQTLIFDVNQDQLLQEVYTTKKAIAIYDVMKDPRADRKACETFGIKSLLVIPLVLKGKLLATMALASVDEYHHYTESEIQICQSIADVTATALSNSLYAGKLDSLVKERTVELQEANLKLENLVKKLKDMDEFKNDFITSLSHELRTPIASIMGSIDILSKQIIGPLNERQKSLVEMADKATERLLSRVNELLDLSKLEYGKISIYPMVCNYRELVEETVNIIKPLFNKKNQAISIEMDTDPWDVCLDKQRIQQVLFNLLSNAHKFTREAGKITVKVTRGEYEVITEVVDSGVGIPEEKQKYIFDKFYQVEHTNCGTGLGLCISKQLVELHGGRIWFQSQVGRGSKFSYALPCK